MYVLDSKGHFFHVERTLFQTDIFEFLAPNRIDNGEKDVNRRIYMGLVT